MELEAIIDGAETGMVVADADMKVVYANKKSKKMFKAALGIENFIGQSLLELHNAESIKKIKELYAAFKVRELTTYHYTVKSHGRTTTIVIVPFYEAGRFSGTIETIFEGALG